MTPPICVRCGRTRADYDGTQFCGMGGGTWEGNGGHLFDDEPRYTTTLALALLAIDDPGAAEVLADATMEGRGPEWSVDFHRPHTDRRWLSNHIVAIVTVGTTYTWSYGHTEAGPGDPIHRALAAALLFGEMQCTPFRPDLHVRDITPPWIARRDRYLLSRASADLRSTAPPDDLNALVSGVLAPFLQQRVTPVLLQHIRHEVASELRARLPDGASPMVHVEQDERDPSRLTVRVEWRDEPRWRLHRAEVSAFLPGAMPPR
jgi:hypothetical protein